VLIKTTRDPADNTKSKDTLDYYLWLAKLADKGKITSIFFADGYGLHQTYQGKPDATYAGGSMVAYMDPVVMVSAMGAVTKSVAFGITGARATFVRFLPDLQFQLRLLILGTAPYMLVRTWSTLGHMTKGRVAWNVVTSYSNSAAKALGKDKVKPSAERYEAATEYMDLCCQLWEKSWEDGAPTW
jgi:alkanesulfonate monooxygenase SsuD/methylene tetrahydromethanopterin reductase-like flavin-dependent oxidoreductase (luciferase family)